MYLGTSIGGFHVLDVSSSFSIRICDYKMPSFTDMPLVEMKICPKDCRYIALAYYNSSTNNGAEGEGLLIIYDMVKNKVSSRFGLPKRRRGTTDTAVRRHVSRAGTGAASASV